VFTVNSLCITNAKIVDGSSRLAYRGDVMVSGGKIVEVGKLSTRNARRVIDADGRVLTPGFIDIHSHSDTTILLNPDADSKIRQGVTTEIIGNCGNSLAPLNGESLEFVDTHFAGYGLVREWNTVKGYLDFVEKCKPAVNIAMLAGHGTIRRGVMGTKNREPSLEEMSGMKTLLKEALAEGVFGMSTGLIYPPGFFSNTEELIDLAKVLAEDDALYVSHIRGEGPTLIEAITEVIEIARSSGVSVHISHHKATGRAHWGKVKKTLAMIDEARQQHLDVTGDMYPYEATNTLLQTFLPRAIHEDGVEAMLRRLEEEEVRIGLIERLSRTDPYRINWENIILAHARKGINETFEGKTLAEIASTRNKTPPETVLDLIREEEGTASVVILSLSEDDIEKVMLHPVIMIGSDGSCLSTEGPLSQGKPHPRSFGTFPRVLSEYVRGKKVLTLESAVNKMTFLAAKRVGLTGRGLISPGYSADLVLFDPDRINDRATYQNPKQYPEGIDYVIVNGESVVENRVQNGKRPGKVLRKR
jgi:N-acyl-D-amino-acid deacylase